MFFWSICAPWCTIFGHPPMYMGLFLLTVSHRRPLCGSPGQNHFRRSSGLATGSTPALHHSNRAIAWRWPHCQSKIWSCVKCGLRHRLFCENFGSIIPMVLIRIIFLWLSTPWWSRCWCLIHSGWWIGLHVMVSFLPWAQTSENWRAMPAGMVSASAKCQPCNVWDSLGRELSNFTSYQYRGALVLFRTGGKACRYLNFDDMTQCRCRSRFCLWRPLTSSYVNHLITLSGNQ